MHHNYWASVEPGSLNYWAHVSQLLKPDALEPSAMQQEKSLQW